MKTPTGLQPLIDDGIVDEVIRALKSGKEASV
jgi:RIO kinase 1